MEEPIDVVITWVDGDDPAHREKMRPYLEATGKRLYEDSTAPTRFRSTGEIFYCVASILRFAPWVRKIFIVTDRQDPELDDFVRQNFPDNKIPIAIVDHTEIFRGYEKYLPIFCARTIETGFYRIPGLSENFIYFNDDFLLARPTDPEDWFAGGKAIARGRWKWSMPFRVLSSLKSLKSRRKPSGFKDSMLNAADVAGGNRRRFFLISHTPHAQKRSVMERFYTEHPEVFEKNLSHRFRNAEQYNPQTLFYLLGLRSGECIARNETELYIKPVGRGKGYLKRKMRDFGKRDPKFICIGSLDMAAPEDRATIQEWLKGVLNIKI